MFQPGGYSDLVCWFGRGFAAWASNPYPSLRVFWLKWVSIVKDFSWKIGPFFYKFAIFAHSPPPPHGSNPYCWAHRKFNTCLLWKLLCSFSFINIWLPSSFQAPRALKSVKSLCLRNCICSTSLTLESNTQQTLKETLDKILRVYPGPISFAMLQVIANLQIYMKN